MLAEPVPLRLLRGMSDDTTEFFIDGRSRRRVVLRGVAGGVAVAAVYALLGRFPTAGLLIGLTIISALILAVGVRPVRIPVVRLAEDAVFLYDPKTKASRRIPWAMLTGVESREPHNQPGVLEFRFGGATLSLQLPKGAPAASEIRDAIRKRIPATPAPTLSARDVFEVFFSVVLPASVRLEHEEFHSADGTGLWVFALPEAEFKQLTVEGGRISEWYPVTSDIRLRIGGREWRGTVDVHGEYSLSTALGTLTPVLVYDRRRGRLTGALSPTVI